MADEGSKKGYENTESLDKALDAALDELFGFAQTSYSGAAKTGSKEIIWDKLKLDYASFDIEIDGMSDIVPPKQFVILYTLAGKPNKVFTISHLVHCVLSNGYDIDDAGVHQCVKQLQDRLNSISDQWKIKTVWGVGYKFEVNE